MVKKVKAHISRCCCGRINICDEDYEEHKKSCVWGGEITEDRKDSAQIEDMIGIIILANERDYILE